MNAKTKCPHCQKEISKVEIQKLPDMGKNDLENPKDRYLVAVCPICETIISVVLNPERKGQSLEGK